MEIGSVVIHWYGVIIAAGILAALQLTPKEAKETKRRLEEDTIIDMALWAIPIDSFGARLYYVLFELGYYLQNPDKSLRFGMAVLRFMGIDCRRGTLYWYAKKKVLLWHSFLIF